MEEPQKQVNENQNAAQQEAVPPPAMVPVGAVPLQSASLYVGDLHPDVTEAFLYDMFNAVGPVASIRVCRDAISRRSLGYAYVNFHHATDAERALDTMNYTMVKDRPCRIMWSQRDPSLRKTGAGNVFVKHLDLSIDNKALYDTFSLFGNILSCKVVTDSKGKSRGYGFVHFETTEAAEEAIKKINGMLLAGKEVFVGKFLKKNDRPNQKDWTNLYVKNIPKAWGKEQLEDLFNECGPVASSIIMETDEGESKGFGFVDFVEHEGAVAAVEKFDGYEPEGGEVKEGDKENDKKENVSEKDEKDKPDGGDAEDKEDEEARSPTALVVCRAQKKSDRERELSKKFEQIKIDRQKQYQGVNLYVKNLDDSVDDELLRKEFEHIGEITSATVMLERGADGKKDGVSKGFGFVCFSNPDDALRAVSEMNGKLIANKPIFVALAQRREQRRAQLEAQHRHGPRMMNVPGMGAQPGMFPYNAGAPMAGMNNMGMNPMALNAGQQFNRFNPQMQMMNQMGMMRGQGAGPRGVPQPMPNAMGRGNMQFNANARNTQQQQLGQQGMRGNFPQGMMGPQVVMEPPLTAEALAKATPQMRKSMIGEKLYPMVVQLEPNNAAKITGMLLEMENNELLHLLESPDALRSKVHEAVEVLENAQ